MLTQADKFHQRIHDQGHVLFSRIKSRTRSRPIGWMIHEAATDGIVVNVIDHRPKRGWFLDVAIISPASLPETIVDLPIGLCVPQTFEKRQGVAAKKGQGFSLHGYFEGRSNEPDFIDRLSWPNDDMDVLRHNDVSPNQEIPPMTGLVQGLDEPLAASVLA
jgi:hypothetical protein